MEKNQIIFRNITKEYPGVKALDNIKFSIDFRTIFGIAGENGSGKSTLLKLLTGIEKVSAGEIFVKGNRIQSIKDSITLKIAMVTQEPSLLEDLSIYENVLIHDCKKKVINWKQKAIIASKYLEKVGLNIDGKKKAGDLSPDQQQLVSIARALSSEPDVLLLDEATSSLNEEQTSTIFHLLMELKEQNKTIIFISHKLKEYLRLCDKILVLRDSEYICTLDNNGLTEDAIISAMVGRELKDLYPSKKEVDPSDDIVTVSDLKIVKTPIENISFTVKKGEIFSLAGLVGCGRSEMLRSFIGEHQLQGKIEFAGEVFQPSNPREALKKGIAYIPAERKTEGIVGHLSVYENATIGIRSKNKLYKLVNKKTDQKTVEEIIKKIGVKTPSMSTPIEFLSGGNQQKVILGRAILLKPKLLLLDEPTRGIDVNAKSEIYHLLRKLTDEGVTVIISSSDLQEIIGISDRVGVLFRGKFKKILIKDEITEETIMHYATGNE